jgi:hypothetical protein
VISLPQATIVSLEVVLAAGGEQVQQEAVALGAGHLLDHAALGAEVAVAHLAQQIEKLVEGLSRGWGGVRHDRISISSAPAAPACDRCGSPFRRPPMIGYVTLGTNDIARAAFFIG